MARDTFRAPAAGMCRSSLACVGHRGPVLRQLALVVVGLRSCRGPMLAYVGWCGPTLAGVGPVLAVVGCCGPAPALAGVGLYWLRWWKWGWCWW
jgi:hypothetical protein